MNRRAEIGDFDEACRSLSDLLCREGRPSEILWTRRRDFYSLGPEQHFVMWPLPVQAEEARTAFEAGAVRGLVRLEALFHVQDRAVATVVAPAPDEIQGWSRGLKLSLRQPFVAAQPVRAGADWSAHLDSPEYLRFHGFAEPGAWT